MSEDNQVREFISDLTEVVNEIKSMLIDKNRKYGDSALNPKRVFSRANPIEQIKVRLDDKISRLQSAQTDDTEDVELDLIGYLLLLRIARKRENEGIVINVCVDQLSDIQTQMAQCLQEPKSVMVISTPQVDDSWVKEKFNNLPSNPYSEGVNVQFDPEKSDPPVRTEKYTREAIA